MATLFNNTEITNAFFNGTELDKIYFNGVLVFEKGGKYKRRIMVGDNLKGKIIISDFPTNFKEELINIVSPDITQVNVISSTNDQSLFFGLYREKYDHPTYGTPTTYVVAGRVDSNRNLYIYTVEDNYESINNYDNYQVQSTEDIVISEINDSAIYRHIYIEDENIRPLKVGDYVLDNTIFYFTFPDDLYLKGNDTAGKHLIAIEQDPIIDDKGNNWVLTASNWYTGNKSIVYGHGTSSSTGYNINNSIYDYDSEEEKLKKNLSKVIAKDMENRNGNIHYYCRGKVVGICKSQNFASHILVDTRTLGTTGYKRRIMVGDNLRNQKIFLENYPENLYDLMYQDGMDGSTTLIDINNEYTIHQNISVEGVYPNYTVLYGYIDTWPLAADEMNTEIYFFDKRETPTTYEIYSPILVKNDIDYLVTKCYDRVGYRVLYIEDPKIRPIQVGDKITENTKFYFNFPDDLYIKLTNYKVDWIIKIENENGDILGIAASTDEENRTIAARRKKHNVSGVYIGTSFYSHYTPFGTTDGELEMNLSHGIAKNILIDRLEPTLYLLGTVSEINTTYADVYKYILVDITTLG